jgi:putative ABC transport system permease protein
MGSVALAVAALSTVAFLSQRLQAGLWRDAHQLLGGDAAWVSDQPVPDAVLAKARAGGLRTSVQLSMASMASAAESAEIAAAGAMPVLVALKAVDDAYPLMGSVQLQGGRIAGAPERGQVWVDAAILSQLSLQVGQALQLGHSQLRIGGVIAQEPDRGMGFMSLAPRVMMHAADVTATGLVQPASRLSWRLVVAGSADAVQGWTLQAQQWLDQQGLRGTRIETLSSGRPEMQQTLERARSFLNLVALLTAVLSAVALAMAARSYAREQLDACALRRVWGQTQTQLLGNHLLQLSLAGVLACGIGAFAGWGLHGGLVAVLQDLWQVQLPSAGPGPWLLSVAVGMVLLWGFGVPPVIQLAKVPALRVLRRQMQPPGVRTWMVTALGLLAFAAITLLFGQDARLVGMTLAGFVLAALVFAVLAGALVRAAALLPGSRRGGWGMALKQLTARPGLTIVQVSAMALGLMALALMLLLRTDLLSSWRQVTPANAPDHFVINVQPDQQQAFRSHVAQSGAELVDWFPMVRGRLVSINGKAVKAEDFEGDRAQRLVEREFNLSYSSSLPDQNTLLQGQWQSGDSGQVSVEDGLANTLGLKLGDRVGFDMAGVVHEARITSVRKVDWTSMRANFFMIYPVASMPQWPTTYLATLRSAQAGDTLDAQLVRQFPNVTTVDLRQTLGQIQRMLDQVMGALQSLFGLSLLSGLLVFWTVLDAGRKQRVHEYAVWRALGASHRRLTTMQALELGLQGLLAGLLATGSALALGWTLARQVLDLPWTVSWWMLPVGALVGALLALLTGQWALRGLLGQSVVQTLRVAQD